MAATVWKGYISFGLISIPVRLFTAARNERVSFHQIHQVCRTIRQHLWPCSGRWGKGHALPIAAHGAAPHSRHHGAGIGIQFREM